MSTKTEMLAAASVSDPRWAAVVARDPEVDGKFFYSVRTTGVYCRPSCAAHRGQRIRAELDRSRTVTAAIVGSGDSLPSRRAQ